MISGFTFVHNAIVAGYPIVEAITAVRPWADEVVVVDMESTDNTREVVEQEGCRVIEGQWIPGGGCHECLQAAHALHEQCYGDVIVHFEADEVYDPFLISHIAYGIRELGRTDALVYRIQVEQNFQRLRWAPHLVHRVFPKGSVEQREHTTDRHDGVENIIGPDHGLLWDCSSTFRGNYMARVAQQRELWGLPLSPSSLQGTF